MDRQLQLKSWLQKQCSASYQEILPLAGDASFRHYFRLITEQDCYVVMDAPPHKENVTIFLQLANRLKEHGLPVPDVLAADVVSGFLLLSDFGQIHLFDHAHTAMSDALYQGAIDALLEWQVVTEIDKLLVPQFDGALYQQEFDLLTEWFLGVHCNVVLTDIERVNLAACYERLLALIDNQPKVLVHRDYHSKNLMIRSDQTVGILDFQDAVWGPITYDLVSLLRDCYVELAPEKIKFWCRYFYDNHPLFAKQCVSYELFLQWFDWTGLQRHIKCLGIFSRLAHRDQKQQYLSYLPRVLNYILTICQRYDGFGVLQTVLEGVINEGNVVSGRSRGADEGMCLQST